MGKNMSQHYTDPDISAPSKQVSWVKMKCFPF